MTRKMGIGMASKIISAEEAEGIMWGKNTHEHTECYGHMRWSNLVRYVFYDEQDGKYWEFFYDEPATEYQEDSFDKEEYECHEVKKVFVEMATYERV